MGAHNAAKRGGTRRHAHQFRTIGAERKGICAWLIYARAVIADHQARAIHPPSRRGRGNEAGGIRIDERAAIAIAKQRW